MDAVLMVLAGFGRRQQVAKVEPFLETSRVTALHSLLSTYSAGRMNEEETERAVGRFVEIFVFGCATPFLRSLTDDASDDGNASGNGPDRISLGLRAVAPRELLTDSLLEFGAIKPSRLAIPCR